MQQFQLSEEELNQTMHRAQEIAAQNVSGGDLETAYRAYLDATGEIGVPREAVLQALRERLDIQTISVAPGDTVFAPSADGFWYIATVRSVQGNSATVEFRVGGERSCLLSELRGSSLPPGTIVHGAWKKDDSWYGARVRSFDAEKNEIEVIYRLDGTVEKLPLERIRLFATETSKKRFPYQILPSPFLDLLLKLTAGGTIGFLLSQFFR